MKAFSVSALVLACTSIVSARSLQTRSLDQFEKRFISQLDYQQHNETVKLVGYKTVKIPLHTQADFNSHYNNHAFNEELDGFRSAFYDPDTAELRIYFPVAEALAQHGGELIEANELGEFEIDALEGDYHVVGRKQTEKVHGHGDNVVKDGIVYLASSNPPSHRHGKVFVYDFGAKDLHDDLHHHHEYRRGEVDEGENGEGSEEQKNRGCIKNHGGINCNEAYGIKNGRCKFDPTTCMDYNGYFSSCKKKDKYLYFVGSDCFSSVAKGNCWNEMVSAEDS